MNAYLNEHLNGHLNEHLNEHLINAKIQTKTYFVYNHFIITKFYRLVTYLLSFDLRFNVAAGLRW